MKIGVFDSGLGGLTILKALLKKLPQYNYVYLGDNARVPYGNRSPETIYEFTKQAVEFLFKKNCKIIILACNTATSTSLRRIQQEYLPKYYPDRRVLGVIKPVVEVLESQITNIKYQIINNKTNSIGIIGTKATVNSGAFVREINKLLPDASVHQQACPLLVPFIEDGSKNNKVLKPILKEYLDGLLKEKIKTLVLACTHYEVIEKEIQKIIGREIKIISEGKIVAKKLGDYLKNHLEIEKKLEKHKKIEYYVTDLNPDYEKIIKIFLGKGLNKNEILYSKLV